MKEFPSGPPEMHAMLAGDLDVAYVGVAPPIAAMYEGLDAKIVAGAQTQGSALVISPELADEYDSVGPLALKGKAIATFPPGSIQHTVLSKWLLDNGIDPEEDVDMKAMDPSHADTAIGAKTVDAVLYRNVTDLFGIHAGAAVAVGIDRHSDRHVFVYGQPARIEQASLVVYFPGHSVERGYNQEENGQGRQQAQNAYRFRSLAPSIGREVLHH